MEGQSSTASCGTGGNASVGTLFRDLPPSYRAHLSTPPIDAEASLIRDEARSFVEASLQDTYSPRKKRSRCSDGEGGLRTVHEDSPKQKKRRKETRIDSKVQAVREAGHPESCCPLNCCRYITAEQLVARAACKASMDFKKRNEEIIDDVLRCRVGPGRRRQDFEWRILGRKVCTPVYALWQGVHLRTLRRKCRKARTLSGVVPSLKPHGNCRRPRQGKGRHDCAKWLQDMFARLAEPFPDRQTRSRQTGEVRTKEFLPTGLFATLQSVYDHYVGANGSLHKPVSYVTFRRAWLQRHFQVRHR